MLTAAVVILAAGAVVTWIGSRLIERAHPPRGRFIEVGGLRQHVVELGETHGEAPPLVLVHGAGCNLEDMRLALGERLAARHRVILIDRAGLGWSERKGRRGGAPAYQAAMLRDVLDRLGVARAILVGHSWGGALALAFGLDHPARSAGLVLLAAPFYPFPRGMFWLYRALAIPFGGWLIAHTLGLPLGLLTIGPAIGSAFLPQLPPWRYLKRSAALLLLRPRAFLANARDMAELSANLAPQVARYPALAPPTVVVSGNCDFVVPLQQHAIAFAAAVPAARLVVLPGIGHMLHHAAAERVVAEIEALAAQPIR
ncbi:MAG TPA: alpha/beta hydrolase [Xanthobacteraceae bacterium]|nr:alpha/beta hydrolase [Xanthobacteraceae bacterium]